MDASLVTIGRRAGEGSSKFELRSLKEQPGVLPSQRSSEAEGDQTEREKEAKGHGFFDRSTG